MSTRAKHTATTPIPLQLAAPEFPEFILPHLSRPKRGPQCKRGYPRLFHLSLWVLYTGMPWTCVPIPKAPQGKPALHDTNVYKAFAKWSDDGSLPQAFMASVAHIAAEKHLDLRVLHGDGTNTVAQKGATGLATRAISTRRARRSSPAPTTRVMCYLPGQSLRPMRRP
jgi:transposase